MAFTLKKYEEIKKEFQTKATVLYMGGKGAIKQELVPSHRLCYILMLNALFEAIEKTLKQKMEGKKEIPDPQLIERDKSLIVTGFMYICIHQLGESSTLSGLLKMTIGLEVPGKGKETIKVPMDDATAVRILRKAKSFYNFLVFEQGDIKNPMLFNHTFSNTGMKLKTFEHTMVDLLAKAEKANYASAREQAKDQKEQKEQREPMIETNFFARLLPSSMSNQNSHQKGGFLNVSPT